MLRDIGDITKNIPISREAGRNKRQGAVFLQMDTLGITSITIDNPIADQNSDKIVGPRKRSGI